MEAQQQVVKEGLSINAITNRLRALGAPTKVGNAWGRSSQNILKNPAYAGRINATPAIISPGLFGAAPKQIKLNSEKSPRNCKHEYLLGGRIRCVRCGKAYYGEAQRENCYYRCQGNHWINSVGDKCNNKGWRADRLEAKVWDELVSYFSNRDLILDKINDQQWDASQVSVFETELGRIEKQLILTDRKQHQLLQWALKGFPESQVEAENKRLNKSIDTLKAQQADLEAQLKASREAVINVPNLERFIEAMQDKLPEMDFEGKRLALEWLGIKVWIDGDKVEVTGIIEPDKDVCVATTTSGQPTP